MDKQSAEKIEQFIIDSGSDDVPHFGGVQGGIQCQQIADEFAPCIEAIMKSRKKIESYLEVGSAAGGSVFLINHFFKPVKIVVVDDNKHPKAHLRPYILRDIPHEEVIGDSHNKNTVDQIKELCGSYDLVLLDGDHFFNGVMEDIKNYGSLLNDGGFLIIHDTQMGHPFGAGKAFEKAKESFEFIGEFVSEKHSRQCGVGLLRRKVEDK